jgi:hypothetical protein
MILFRIMSHKLAIGLLLVCVLASPGARAADYFDLQETLKQLTNLLAQQQKELDEQRKELAEQRVLIQQLQGKPLAADTSADTPPSADTSESAADLAQQPGTAPTGTSDPVSDAPSVTEQAQQALAVKVSSDPDSSMAQIRDLQAAMDDPSNTIYNKDFPGAWYLPGTSAAMKIGGYVNLGITNTFSPMTQPEGFIVGTIPPKGLPVEGAVEGSIVTANQSRVNVEYREQTKLGEVRAFVEGDFRGNDNTFRLRHAFGQFRTVLAGKTWSTFMDVDARPEEVDIDGINGQVYVRQSQIRWTPEFGSKMNLRLALENPTTLVSNGTSSTGRADLVASFNRMPLGPFGRYNYRVGFILRDLSALPVSDDSNDVFENNGVNTTGWGISTSGRRPLNVHGEQTDFLLWQLTYGKGVGRYINDLGIIGVGDAVFDPEGQLRALPVFAGYVSYQHLWPMTRWFFKDWPGILRSSFTASWVNIKNYEFEDGSNYNQTRRASANLIYNPTQNVFLGIEYLWGERVNKNNTKGDATQFQLAIRYDF